MGRGLDGFFDARDIGCCCAILKARGGCLSTFSGGYGEGETPLPIPNRAVKPLSADGTWPARAWESRSPPVLHDIEPQSPSGDRGSLRSGRVVARGRVRRMRPRQSRSLASVVAGAGRPPAIGETQWCGRAAVTPARRG